MDKVERAKTAKKIALRIEQLANNRGISVSNLLDICGLPHSTVDNMKNGSMPQADKLYYIARQLEVSSDSLLGLEQSQYTKKDAPDGAPFVVDLDNDDYKIFSSLPPDLRKQALGYLRYLAENEASEK